jgi:hypothetical protein
MSDKVSHGLETQSRYLLHTGLNVRVHAPLKTGHHMLSFGQRV